MHTFPIAQRRNPSEDTPPARIPNLSLDGDDQIIHDMIDPKNRAAVSYALSGTLSRYSNVFVKWGEVSTTKPHLQAFTLICRLTWAAGQNLASEQKTEYKAFWWCSRSNSVEPRQVNRDLEQIKRTRALASRRFRPSGNATGGVGAWSEGVDGENGGIEGENGEEGSWDQVRAETIAAIA